MYEENQRNIFDIYIYVRTVYVYPVVSFFIISCRTTLPNFVFELPKTKAQNCECVDFWMLLKRARIPDIHEICIFLDHIGDLPVIRFTTRNRVHGESKYDPRGKTQGDKK